MSDINIQNLFMGLAPPSSLNPDYDNLAVNIKGVPIGQEAGKVIAQLLGFSDKDTIGPAMNAVIVMTNMLNAALRLTGKSIDQSIVDYNNTVDPATPGLPPIKSLLILLERNLQAGKLGNVQIDLQERKTKSAVISYPEVDNYPHNPFDHSILKDYEQQRKQISQDAQDNIDIGRQINIDDIPADKPIPINKPQTNLNIDDPIPINPGHGILPGLADDPISKTPGHGILPGLQDPNSPALIPTNPWLSGGSYITFLMAFMELQRVLMKNKMVQGNIELASMELTYRLAKETATMIMEIAKENQMIHIVQAVGAGVSIGFAVAGFGASALGVAGKLPGTQGLSVEQTISFSTAVSSAFSAVGGGIDKFMGSTTQAATDMGIAQKEGAKETLQAVRTLIQRQMEKSGEAFKASEDLISQLLQTLDKMRDSLHQAVAGSLRK